MNTLEKLLYPDFSIFFSMVKFDKKAGVTGAVVGAVTASMSGVTNLPLIEKIVVGCIAGIIVAVIMHLVWK